MELEEARSQFPVLERYAYLNAGTNGPLARATVEAIRRENERELAEGRSGQAYVDEMLALREEVRAGFAAVLGAGLGSVALTDSTTRGCAIVVQGLDLAADDEVITTDHEHFGLTGPLYATGARIVVVAAEEDAIAAAVTPRTRLVATSHVLWTTGRRLDVHGIRAATGVPILVDGAQSAGAIPVELGELDYYTVSAQKWICGPESTGALYVADPERVRMKSPSYLSQDGYEPSGAFVPKEGARRFDSGWTPVASLAGLIAALGVHPEWRYEHAVEMAARCRELLEPHVDVVTPPGHSTLVSFRPQGDPAELVASLHEQGVVVRDLPGRGLVRASCGWWTNEDDLQRLTGGIA